MTGPEESTQHEIPVFADTTGKVLAGSGLITDGAGTLTDGAIGTDVVINTNDGNFNFFDDSDPTKQCRFRLGEIATGTTRTITIPDASGKVALLQDGVIYGGSAASGTIAISSTSHATKGILTLGDPGDTVVGDSTQRDLYAQTDLKVDLGKPSNRFNEGWIHQLHVQQSTANVSSPPTDAELDSAFGTPATLGRGFIGTVDDNDGDATMWLCITSDASWYTVATTKAV